MHLALRVVLSLALALTYIALPREVTIAADPSTWAPSKRSSWVRACISELRNPNSKLHEEGHGTFFKVGKNI